MSLNETHSKVHIVKNMFDALPIQNSLQQEYDLSPLLFNFTFEHTIRKVQENQE